MSDVFAHEIPSGSRLYFGVSAAIKRRVESMASDILLKANFSEIVTPYFSYHQGLSVDPRLLLRLSDVSNSELSLRADSTVDVVRIAMRRLKEHGRYYYIQPVFKYPSHEIYQIGAESIGVNELSLHTDLAIKLFSNLGLNSATLQLSHIGIPLAICELLDVDIALFRDSMVEDILALNVGWLNELLRVKSIDDLERIKLPNEIAKKVKSLVELARSIKFQSVRVEPLYYSRMRYYEGLFFRLIEANTTLASGGEYMVDEIECSGFAVYTDAVVEKISIKETK